MTSKNIASTTASVAGINIYKDSRNRTVYFDRLTKDGYVITAHNVNQYNFYSKRFLIPLIAFALLSTLNVGGYKLGFGKAALICLGIIIVMEYLFRFRFLKSLTTIPNFRPEKKKPYLQQIIDSNTNKFVIFLKAILYLALGIIFIYYAYLSNYDLVEWFVAGTVSIAAIWYGIIYFCALFKTLKK